MSSETTTIEKCDKCGVSRTSTRDNLDFTKEDEEKDMWLSIWREKDDYDLCEKCADEFIKSLKQV